ncbi:uncharacterized protein LOC143258642 [Tachypleus tridentatus]|uniref:uncharacterized protein LOC143258642 n=1 Tax=Tachypleus tridentatus TaxID=6853 RepID=UPI003FD10897
MFTKNEGSIMFQKVFYVALAGFVTSSSFARGEATPLSKRYHDNKGNFAYSILTDTHRGITYFQKGESAFNNTQRPEAFVSGAPVSDQTTLPVPPSVGQFKVSLPAIFKNDTLDTAANSRFNAVPVYPPMDRNFLYTMGYIYLKDFLPQSFLY